MALYKSIIQTPLGNMIAIADDTHLHMLEFHDRKNIDKNIEKLQKRLNTKIYDGTCTPIKNIESELSNYFKGTLKTFKTPITIHGTVFTKTVWSGLQKTPYGTTKTYKGLAISIGNDNGFRAVARANASNILAIIIPCHRVISTNGTLGGYAGGLWRKEKLLELERQ